MGACCGGDSATENHNDEKGIPLLQEEQSSQNQMNQPQVHFGVNPSSGQDRTPQSKNDPQTSSSSSNEIKLAKNDEENEERMNLLSNNLKSEADLSESLIDAETLKSFDNQPLNQNLKPLEQSDIEASDDDTNGDRSSIASPTNSSEKKLPRVRDLKKVKSVKRIHSPKKGSSSPKKRTIGDFKVRARKSKRPDKDISISIKSIRSQFPMIPLTINWNNEVKALKEKIAEVTPDKIDVQRQRLIHRGRVLKDHKTLAHFGIDNGHSIMLVRSSKKQQQSGYLASSKGASDDSGAKQAGSGNSLASPFVGRPRSHTDSGLPQVSPTATPSPPPPVDD